MWRNKRNQFDGYSENTARLARRYYEAAVGAHLDADTCAGVDDYSHAVVETALGLGGSFVVPHADPQAAQAVQAANISAARGHVQAVDVGVGADDNDNGYIVVAEDEDGGGGGYLVAAANNN